MSPDERNERKEAIWSEWNKEIRRIRIVRENALEDLEREK